MPVPAWITRLSLLDRRAFDAVARTPSPLLDHTMRPLSAAADHSKLWIAIAAAISSDRSLRRPAIRGVATHAVTSLVVNQGFKCLYPRDRPVSDVVPHVRHRRQPGSSSFPAYPTFVRLRTRFMRRRLARPVATLRAIRGVLRISCGVNVRIDGRPVLVSYFFLGTSIYGPPSFLPGRRARLDDGLLDVRYLEDGHRFAVARLLLSWLSGRVTHSAIYHEVQATELQIDADEPFRVAHDGEVGEFYRSARFQVRYRALRVFGTGEFAG